MGKVRTPDHNDEDSLRIIVNHQSILSQMPSCITFSRKTIVTLFDDNAFLNCEPDEYEAAEKAEEQVAMRYDTKGSCMHQNKVTIYETLDSALQTRLQRSI